MPVRTKAQQAEGNKRESVANAANSPKGNTATRRSGTSSRVPDRSIVAVRAKKPTKPPRAPVPVAKSRVQKPMKAQTFRALRAQLRNAPLAERVAIEREGVPFQVVQGLIEGIGSSSSDFRRNVLRMPKATFSKKMKEMALFSGTPGQSVVGLLELINKVEDMLLAEHGDALAGFDVEKWVGQWIQRPQPALGGMAPADLLDTPSGRESVMRVLGAIQSGAYQ